MLLLEAMVSALRERLREEETRNLQLQGEWRGREAGGGTKTAFEGGKGAP